jgi:hypothetical protein
MLKILVRLLQIIDGRGRQTMGLRRSYLSITQVINIHHAFVAKLKDRGPMMRAIMAVVLTCS